MFILEGTIFASLHTGYKYLRVKYIGLSSGSGLLRCQMDIWVPYILFTYKKIALHVVRISREPNQDEPWPSNLVDHP